ncbi:MAG: hypothetical protein CMM30_05440 [Rhodospirillaceae bacterium]|nr:hypothetical protein [Rhodospirillaceae bacterium]
MQKINVNLYSRNTLKVASRNTMWCLIGCSFGDLGTILFFQLMGITWHSMFIMLLAVINGILSSIFLETIILTRQLPFRLAFKTAIGMSIISMIAMEIAMNTVDFYIIGEAKLTWWIIPIMLLAGFFTALPYNYFRLKKYGKSCH